MDPLTMALITAGISAGGSALGGYLGKSDNKETKNQKTSRRETDQLLKGMRGEGPYANLFNLDDNAFQKSFVQPSLNRFQNQVAPAIQQQYLQAGQQRGSGIEDTLTRAGVDLNSMLDQNYLGFMEKGKDRMSNILSGVMGQGAGAQVPQSGMNAAGQGFAGFLTSPAFSNIFEKYNERPLAQQNQPPAPKGFAGDWGTMGATRGFG